MLELSFVICGVRVVVRTNDRRIFDLLAPSFVDHHDKDQKIESEVAYWIVTSSSHIPHPVAKCLLDFEQSALPNHEPYLYKRTSEGVFYKDKYASWYLGSGFCYCIFDLDFWIETGYGYNDFYYLIFRTMFYEGLWQRSRFWLHASGIQHQIFGPILFVGDRHHAKSTISIAFCDAGHQLLTDDTIFFTDSQAGICEFHTLQREFHLEPDLGTKIKRLSKIRFRPPYDDEATKVSVGFREFFPDCIIDRMLGARAIIFPQIIECPTSRAISLGRFEAFWRLLCHSYTGLFDPESTITPRFLRCLRNIVEKSVSFVFLCGTDCYEEPSLYVKIIETELAKRVFNSEKKPKIYSEAF